MSRDRSSKCSLVSGKSTSTSTERSPTMPIYSAWSSTSASAWAVSSVGTGSMRGIVGSVPSSSHGSADSSSPITAISLSSETLSVLCATWSASGSARQCSSVSSNDMMASWIMARSIRSTEIASWNMTYSPVLSWLSTDPHGVRIRTYCIKSTLRRHRARQSRWTWVS